MYGYSGKKLVVDLERARTAEEPLDEKTALTFLGGRGLNIAGLLDETPLDREPLSPENTL